MWVPSNLSRGLNGIFIIKKGLVKDEASPIHVIKGLRRLSLINENLNDIGPWSPFYTT
jgi:hypothetical protein